LDEVVYLWHGERRQLTRQQVIDRLRAVVPEPIQTWAVEIEDAVYPVKQAFAIAARTQRADFVTTQARDVLRKLGFRVFDVKDIRNQSATPSQPAPDALTVSLELRRIALGRAIEFYGDRNDATPKQVVAAAAIYERYLRGAGDLLAGK